ncbi:twin-arginine translocase subunit TatC [Candidatus Sumerlaeota bacterium]|nr:twin-arginine translocase subunit TatC [Candidatus Sumerlaeota bacterium]
MTLIGHLDELRTRLIICAVTLMLATAVSFFFAKPVLKILILPVSTVNRMEASNASAIAQDGDGANETNDPRATFVLSPDGSISWRFDDPERLEEWIDGAGSRKASTSFFAGLFGGDRETSESLAVQLEPLPLSIELIYDGGSGPITIPVIPSFGPAGSFFGQSGSLFYRSPLDPIMVLLKVAIVMGILISLVVWVWQVWLFMAPGLTDREKRVVRPMLQCAIFLFPLGAVFVYFIFFMLVIVMQNYTLSGILPLNDVQVYLKLMTTMMLVFGFLFELPLVIALLARIGVVTPAFLRHYRRHIYVGLAVVSMFLTPSDPFTMVAAMIPLTLLFELSIWVAGVMALMRSRDEEPDGTGSA